MKNDYQEVTNEYKAKVFGLYIGSPIEINQFGTAYAICNGATYDKYNQTFSVWDDDNSGYGKAFDVFLMLKPLEKITDEHAIEVALICCEGSKDEVSVSIYERNEQGITLSLGAAYYKIFWDGNVVAAASLTSPDYVPILNISHVVDFLRSQGYHLPYMGFDLYDANIAIKA